MKNARVLILTPSANDHGLGLFYERAFVELGCATLKLGVSPVASRDQLKYRALNKLYAIAVTIENVANIYFEVILKQVRRFSPNVIIVIRCETLSGEQVATLRSIASDGVFNVYPDSPLAIPTIDKLRAKNAIPQFSGVFTFARALVPVFYQLGAVKAFYLPFGFDSRTHQPQPRDHDRTNIGYFGTWGRGPEYWLRCVLPYGLAIYGDGWARVPHSDPLRRVWARSSGTLGDFAKKIASVEIVFNIVRAEHGCTQSMKTFEIPACGGFQLTNRTEEQLSFFREGVDCEYYDSVDELTSKLEFYLRNPTSVKRIARSGLVASAPHTYVSRARKIKNLFSNGAFEDDYSMGKDSDNRLG